MLYHLAVLDSDLIDRGSHSPFPEGIRPMPTRMTFSWAASDGSNGDHFDFQLRERPSCSLNDPAEQLRSVWTWLVLGLLIAVNGGHDLWHPLHIAGRETAEHQAQKTRRQFRLSGLNHVHTVGLAKKPENPYNAVRPAQGPGAASSPGGAGRLRHESGRRITGCFARQDASPVTSSTPRLRTAAA